MTGTILVTTALVAVCLASSCEAFHTTSSVTISISSPSLYPVRPTTTSRSTTLQLQDNNDEWTSDFDDFVGGDGGDETVSSFFQTTKSSTSRDLSAISVRQFSLGQDLILSDYVGTMGFDEVTDWEYYYQNNEDPDDRKVVQPNPMDSSQPKRTRQRSGSVVRVFRGEFVGRVGGGISSQGLDRRILVKEFTGEMALKLADAELKSIGKLQSELVADDEEAAGGYWIQVASSRSVMGRQDDRNVADLSRRILKAPFLGILGEVNLAELEGELDANDFYRALGVPPPPPEAVWIVYEYAGLNTLASYAVPAQVRRSRLPLKKNFFGTTEPDPVPAFKDRANYIVKGIMKGAVEAVADLHDSGIVHRSIGRSSLIITCPTQDKQEPSGLYFTRPNAVTIKLSDFGFSCPLQDASNDEEFVGRARTFGVSLRKGEDSLTATNFAMAEDLHALGFVFLGLLMSSLAELPRAQSPMPATDEDTLQRLLGEIFDKDIDQFRDYLDAEEVWSNLVQLLDANDRAGWNVLEALFKAREKVAENKNALQVVTARGLLSNPFFQS